jgi:hypothetical protein
MKRFLLAGTVLAALVLPAAANATLVLTFGQTDPGATITATVNGTDTQTTLSGTDIPVSITQILGGAPASGFLDLAATSVGAAATTIGGLIEQLFTGTFSITSLMGKAGTNFLSGTFADATFGAGTGLTLTASDATAGESVTFNSSVIPAADLLPPQSINLALADVTPNVNITGTTLGAFTSSVGGDFSATTAAVPEPITLAVLGVGMAGLGFVRRQRRTV